MHRQNTNDQDNLAAEQASSQQNEQQNRETRINRVHPAEAAVVEPPVQEASTVTLPAANIVTQNESNNEQNLQNHSQQTMQKELLSLGFKLKSAVFLFHLFLITVQLLNCSEEEVSKLKQVVPAAFYFTILNLSYLVFETIYYMVIGCYYKEAIVIQAITFVIQLISTGFMVWGILIENSPNFMKYKEENKDDQDKPQELMTQDMVIIFSQMIHLRLIYISLLVLMKVLWLMIPMLLRNYGDSYQTQEQREEELKQILNSLEQRAKNHDKSTNPTAETCAICLQDFECDGPKIVQLDCNSNHVFHLECLSKWIKTQSKCPMCRHPIQINIKSKDDN